MRQSELFSKTRKEFPKDEESTNARLLIKGGFVQKMSAGVYSFLPLGWRVLNKVNAIIREEMDAIGGQELLMPALVAKEYWEKAKRWDVDVTYKVKHEHGGEFGLGWTHEEVITNIATNFIHSYKDLPKAVYQIQTKFRAEERAKSGLLRGREFLMKDLYSFHTDESDLDRYYQKALNAYRKIFSRLFLKAKVVEASGGAFTKEFTHEFQVPSDIGEDTIYFCPKCEFARNKDIFDGGKCPNCGGETSQESGIEVANIFKLGTRFSGAFDLTFVDETGNRKPVVMGSYGIGPSRIIGALVEIFNDKKGIIWPESVAPYKFHLLDLGDKKNADEVYKKVSDAGGEILYDDREMSAGEKFNDGDLLGIPYRLVISEKTNGKIEMKKRNESDSRLISIKEIT